MAVAATTILLVFLEFFVKRQEQQEKEQQDEPYDKQSLQILYQETHPRCGRYVALSETEHVLFLAVLCVDAF